MKIFQPKTPEQVKNEKIAMLKSRLMAYKSSHSEPDEQSAELESLLADAEAL